MAFEKNLLVCAPIEGKTMAEMLVSMDEAKAEGADLVELRIDSMTFSHISEVEKLIKLRTLPAIVSFRYLISQRFYNILYLVKNIFIKLMHPTKHYLICSNLFSTIYYHFFIVTVLKSLNQIVCVYIYIFSHTKVFLLDLQIIIHVITGRHLLFPFYHVFVQSSCFYVPYFSRRQIKTRVVNWSACHFLTCDPPDHREKQPIN